MADPPFLAESNFLFRLLLAYDIGWLNIELCSLVF